jgi:cation:H+ antiporter
MLAQQPWPLSLSVGVFAAAALIIGVAGVLLTAKAERLARVTGLGELLTGAVLIGLVTPLSGLVTSVTAAQAAGMPRSR